MESREEQPWTPTSEQEREFFIDNLHLIIEMILVDRPRAMKV